MIEKCEHDKVYAQFVLASNPPKSPWVCRKCGEQGYDTQGYTPMSEYEYILKKFKK